jgi:hypothetical protein
VAPPPPNPPLLVRDRPEATPAPVYKRWWFWTAIGAVAAGAAVGIVLATRTHTPPCVPKDGMQACF